MSTFNNLNFLNKKKLEKFLHLAGNRLTGGWALIGGTVLMVLNVKYRVTTDIDIVGLDNPGQSETLQLMDLAHELGLPIESINQAGAYFLMKIPSFRKHLILLYRGESASIFIPDIFLYFQLKIQRFSESDLADCIQYLEICTYRNNPFDPKGLLKLLKKELNKINSTLKQKRLRKLLNIIRTL